MLKNNGVSIVILLSCFICMQAHADKRILKWVDSKGVTHYGDQMPPTSAGRSNQEINGQGITVKRNTKAVTKTEDDRLTKEKQEQQRKDNVLLASYTTAEEIDLARNRNLDMEKAALQALTLQKENVDERIQRTIKMAENFKTKKKPVPDYLQEEIKLAKAESNKFAKKISAHESVLDKINRQYDTEKYRFITLKANLTQH